MELETRLRVEAADLGDHFGEFGHIDADPTQELREVATRHEFEIVEKRLHDRVQAIPVFELQRQAFGEATGENTRRIEILHTGESLFDAPGFAAQQRRDLGNVGRQIPGLVEGIDEVKADHPINRIDDLDVELGRQMIARRRRVVGDIGGWHFLAVGIDAAGDWSFRG